MSNKKVKFGKPEKLHKKARHTRTPILFGGDEIGSILAHYSHGIVSDYEIHLDFYKYRTHFDPNDYETFARGALADAKEFVRLAVDEWQQGGADLEDRLQELRYEFP